MKSPLVTGLRRDAARMADGVDVNGREGIMDRTE